MEQQLEGTCEQLNSEKSTVRSLEEVLNDKRRSEWSSEANLKQLELEKAQLQRKVNITFIINYFFLLSRNLQSFFNIHKYY